ncbi:hypothetical protein F4820DRAFT_395030 [Hypoxylon rubiginosum]|uniref:Uncharacterized protein n=1 Tax=Hypoxylon rubiginosum TaxID=110542 RepID=A0ACB9YU69_9PEZI|nr:hypothetical protein F4820DRAFT_395030 [Hypoxylon rubiginosum]
MRNNNNNRTEQVVLFFCLSWMRYKFMPWYLILLIYPASYVSFYEGKAQQEILAISYHRCITYLELETYDVSSKGVDRAGWNRKIGKPRLAGRVHQRLKQTHLSHVSTWIGRKSTGPGAVKYFRLALGPLAPQPKPSRTHVVYWVIYNIPNYLLP